MTKNQENFLHALQNLGLSMPTLMAVGALIQADKDIHEMSGRILELLDSGQKVTNGAVGQILFVMMKEASEPETP